MDIPKIKSVTALENKRLLVTFTNGVQKVYDCDALVHLMPFRVLENKAFFKAVQVDAGGYGISWDDKTDLSEYELWTNGVELKHDMA